MSPAAVTGGIKVSGGLPFISMQYLRNVRLCWTRTVDELIRFWWPKVRGYHVYFVVTLLFLKSQWSASLWLAIAQKTERWLPHHLTKVYNHGNSIFFFSFVFLVEICIKTKTLLPILITNRHENEGAWKEVFRVNGQVQQKNWKPCFLFSQGIIFVYILTLCLIKLACLSHRRATQWENIEKLQRMALTRFEPRTAVLWSSSAKHW